MEKRADNLDNSGSWWTRYGWLLLILAVAAYVRLANLGLSAFRADTILFWTLAQRSPSLTDLLTRWFEVSGAIGQMPLAAVIMQSFLNLVPGDGPLTPFLVRLPFALTGWLVVPVAFWTGRQLYGRTFGLLLAAFAALSTFAVYHSREAYVYAAVLLGYFLYAGSLFHVCAGLRQAKPWPASTWWALAAGILFSSYSQVTGVFVVAAGFLVMGFLGFQQRKQGLVRGLMVRLVVIHIVVLRPLLLVSWGYRPILQQIFANVSAGKAVVSSSGDATLPALGRMILQVSWGSTVPGALILLTGLASAVVFGLRRRDPVVAICGFMIVIQVVLFLVTRSVAGANFEPRYLSGIFPFVAVLALLGFLRFPWGQSKVAPALGVLGALAAILYFAVPTEAVTRLTGKPTPYREIVAWCDRELPAQTPVLVDRWFEPWNELAAHPSTNVVFTFTQPNEPLQNFLGSRWRSGAEQFFARHPDAAYLEIAKTYWTEPGVGPWNYPAQYFARHVVFTNFAGLTLREWGLASRGDFYAGNTNRVVVDVYYNTREDVMRQRAAAGQQLLPYYGAGWGFEKTGPMGFLRVRTQDFRDWRRLDGTAALQLINLTTNPVTAQLTLRGVAINGAKKVTAGSEYHHTFPAGQLDRWTIGPLALQPGINEVTLRDSLWPAGQNPLLVESVELRAAVPVTAAAVTTETKP